MLIIQPCTAEEQGVTVVTVFFRGKNVEWNFIIIYIIYYIYNNIVEVGENLIVTTVTTVTDCLNYVLILQSLHGKTAGALISIYT